MDKPIMTPYNMRSRPKDRIKDNSSDVRIIDQQTKVLKDGKCPIPTFGRYMITFVMGIIFGLLLWMFHALWNKIFVQEAIDPVSYAREALEDDPFIQQ